MWWGWAGCGGARGVSEVGIGVLREGVVLEGVGMGMRKYRTLFQGCSTFNCAYISSMNVSPSAKI